MRITIRYNMLCLGETPGENDLFPSTPLDEDQLPHADSKFKEELGSVIINEIEVIKSIIYKFSKYKKTA